MGITLDPTMEKLQSPLGHVAIIQDSGVDLGLHGGVVAALLIGGSKGSGESDHPDAALRELAVAISPAVVPDAVDPALEDRRHRPPVDRKEHDRRIVLLDPGHFLAYLGR